MGFWRDSRGLGGGEEVEVPVCTMRSKPWAAVNIKRNSSSLEVLMFTEHTVRDIISAVEKSRQRPSWSCANEKADLKPNLSTRTTTSPSFSLETSISLFTDAASGSPAAPPRFTHMWTFWRMEDMARAAGWGGDAPSYVGIHLPNRVLVFPIPRLTNLTSNMFRRRQRCENTIYFFNNARLGFFRCYTNVESSCSPSNLSAIQLQSITTSMQLVKFKRRKRGPIDT